MSCNRDKAIADALAYIGGDLHQYLEWQQQNPTAKLSVARASQMYARAIEALQTEPTLHCTCDLRNQPLADNYLPYEHLADCDLYEAEA